MRFGLLFSHQAPPGSGVSFAEPYRDMLECLPEAEELGYSSCFQVSHHVQPDGLCPSPLLACAAAAAVTRRMRIGTGCLLVPLYAPVKLAEDVAVLDNISGGRFTFGVAPGYVSEEFEAHGVPREERFRRFWSALDTLEQAWADGSPVTPKPVQRPGPPLWFGLSGPRSLARAARRPGAVLLPSPRHSVEEIAGHLALWRDAGGRTDELPVIREVFVAETRAEAERIAAPAVTYLFRELYGAKSAQGERELRDDAGNVVSTKEHVDFERFRSRYVIGDPDDARREIARLRDELGATEVICWMHIPGIRGEDALRSVRLFAAEVM